MRWSSGLFTAAVLLRVLPAYAQGARAVPDPVVSQPAACSDTGPADVLQAARRHFGAGQILVDSRAFREAEGEFRAALRLYDSPNSHYLLGRALRGQNRNAEAYAEFDLTVLLAARCSQADASRGAANRYQQTVVRALGERDELTSRVALVGVRLGGATPANASIAVNTVALPGDAAGRVLAYAPGDVEVVVSAPGFASFRATRNAAAGQTTWVDVSLERAAEAQHPGAIAVSTASAAPASPAPAAREVPPAPVAARPTSIARPVGIALGVAGVAAAISGGAMFFLAQGQFAHLNSLCTPACPNDAGYLSQIAGGQSLELAGMVTFWSGIGVVAVGATVLVVAGRSSERGPRTVAAWPSVDPFTRTVGFGASF